MALAGLCASDVNWESGGCIDYVDGVADAFDHRYLSISRDANYRKYCIPGSATRENVVGLVVKFSE